MSEFDLWTFNSKVYPATEPLVAALGVGRSHLLLIAVLIAALEIVHAFQERNGSVRARVRLVPAYGRWAIYYASVAVLMTLGVFNDSRFIYFQF